MFDDILRTAALGTENFRDGVRDSFGAAMIADVLDPILKEIDSLRHFNEEFRRQALNIDLGLEAARAIRLREGGST